MIHIAKKNTEWSDSKF